MQTNRPRKAYSGHSRLKGIILIIIGAVILSTVVATFILKLIAALFGVFLIHQGLMMSGHLGQFTAYYTTLRRR